jgi:NitT/TauT family transport system substrate-binding protein
MIKVLFLIISILLISCSKPKEYELKIATNVWIGYAPLFYAKEKGYLDEINIDLITTVSLGESANIFLVSKAQLLTTTQHEYNMLQKEIGSIVPIILMDRSNGGDMILSNKTIDELKKSKQIDAYLEVDSINKEMIKDFTRIHKLDSKHINYINKDQAQIQNIKYDNSKDIIIVTYTPNDITLLEEGFQEVASTRDTDTLLVVDAIATSRSTFQREKKRLKKLKKIIDKSIQEIMADKITAHELTQKYLNNISYKEFVNSIKSIKWINEPSEELLLKIDKMGYKKEDLL